MKQQSLEGTTVTSCQIVKIYRHLYSRLSPENTFWFAVELFGRHQLMLSGFDDPEIVGKAIEQAFGGARRGPEHGAGYY